MQTCATCAATTDKDRLPPNWKKIGERVYCPDCKARDWTIRCVTVPMASVVAEYDPPDWGVERCRAGWRAFRKAVRDGQRDTARLANRLLFELARRDALPLEPGEKGPKLPKLTEDPAGLKRELYHLGRAEYPDLDSQAVSGIGLTVLARYKAARFAVRVLASETLPTFRELPVPVPQAAQRGFWVSDQKQPFLAFRLGGSRFTIRLRNGHSPAGDYRRAGRTLERIARGEGSIGEYSFLEVPVGGSARDRGNGGRGPTQIKCRISAWLPVDRAAADPRALVLKTGTDALLTALIEDRPLWSLHEDHARARIAAYRDRLKRLSDDTKFERRRPKPNREQINHKRDVIGRNHRNWLRDFQHKAAAMAVGLALRNRCDTIRYDDSDHSWFQAFPWFTLRTLIAEKCGQKGLTFVHAGTPDEVDAAGAPELD